MSNIRPEFSTHKLNAQGVKRAEFLAVVFSESLDEIEMLSGKDGRKMALVRTKLEEAKMLAVSAMAERSENQEPAVAAP